MTPEHRNHHRGWADRNGGKQNGLSKAGPICIKQLANLAVREPCLKRMRGTCILEPPDRKHGHQFPCGGHLA
jgi:hypothetical protein